MEVIHCKEKISNSLRRNNKHTSFILRRTNFSLPYTTKMLHVRIKLTNRSTNTIHIHVVSLLILPKMSSARLANNGLNVFFCKNNQTTFCKLHTLKIKEVLNNTYLMTISLNQALNQQQILESKTKKTWSSVDLYNLCGLKCMTVYILHVNI